MKRAFVVLRGGPQRFRFLACPIDFCARAVFDLAHLGARGLALSGDRAILSLELFVEGRHLALVLCLPGLRGLALT